MGERILTDSRGRRWDVSDGETGLRFRHPPDGPSYDVPSERTVDQLRDTDLITLLDQARVREGEEPAGEANGEEGSEDGGY